MKQKLYNSKFEILPRLMLLTSFDQEKTYTEDQMIAYDFMTIYSGEFLRQGRNLHGDNGFKYSEFAARKQAVSGAIKELVRKGMLQVKLQDGFKYSATDAGVDRFKHMESSYASEYTEQLQLIMNQYSEYSESDLQKLIRSKSMKE